MEKIDPRHLLVNIAKTLERLKIPYMVTGGMAVLVWGRPRFTADIDIVINLIEPQLNNLANALREISDAGYIDKEMAKEAIRRKGEFNFIDGETGIKIDFWVSRGDELTLLQFKRKIAKNILSQKIYFISPEDLILAKLQWHKQNESGKQLEDVESILKISGDGLDMQYLKRWAEKLNMLNALNNLLKS